MRIGILGINHKSATLSMREELAKALLKRFRFLHPDFAYVSLSTCNRSEIYFHSSNLPKTHITLLNVLRGELATDFEPHIYTYFGVDCFFHLARVTSGFDSAVLGETEIQGQVKEAYESSQELSSELHFLFQKALKLAKKMRSNYPLSCRIPTLEHTLYRRIGTKPRILFVGLSKINQKLFHYFRRRGIDDMTFCNRTDAKLEGFDAQCLPWSALHQWATFDVVIVATRATTYLLNGRGSQNTQVFDLSLPRNVNPALVRDVELMNIDDIHQEMEKVRSGVEREVVHLERRVLLGEVERQHTLFEIKRLQRRVRLSGVG